LATDKFGHIFITGSVTRWCDTIV